MIVNKNGTSKHPLIKESNQANDVEVVISHVEQLKQESAPSINSIKSTNYQHDWIVDLRCLDHMIGDVNKLQCMTEYKGDCVGVMQMILNANHPYR